MHAHTMQPPSLLRAACTLPHGPCFPLTLCVQRSLAGLVLGDLHGLVLLAPLAEGLLGLGDVHLWGPVRRINHVKQERDIENPGRGTTDLISGGECDGCATSPTRAQAVAIHNMHACWLTILPPLLKNR